MTLPEDVRGEMIDKIYRDIERMTLQKGMNLRSQAEYYVDLLTSAKAEGMRIGAEKKVMHLPDQEQMALIAASRYEGYQEGVKAMRNAVYPLSDRTDDDIDTVADQLLNKKEKE